MWCGQVVGQRSVSALYSVHVWSGRYHQREWCTTGRQNPGPASSWCDAAVHAVSQLLAAFAARRAFLLSDVTSTCPLFVYFVTIDRCVLLKFTNISSTVPGMLSFARSRVHISPEAALTQRAIPPWSVNEYQRKLGSKRACHGMH